MYVDASALTAMVVGESDAGELAARLQGARVRVTSPLAIWETVIAVARKLTLTPRDAQEAVEEFLETAGIAVVAVPREAGAEAVATFERYGKGRHPAGLNFGDCFAYAGARMARLPLLYKGGDFALTDIEAA